MRAYPSTLADLDGVVALCSAKENADQSLVLIAHCGSDSADAVKRKDCHSMEGIAGGVNVASARVVKAGCLEVRFVAGDGAMWAC